MPDTACAMASEDRAELIPGVGWSPMKTGSLALAPASLGPTMTPPASGDRVTSSMVNAAPAMPAAALPIAMMCTGSAERSGRAVISRVTASAGSAARNAAAWRSSSSSRIH